MSRISGNPESLLTIDEAQRAPELVPALKRNVGRVAGIEVKAGQNAGRNDNRWLSQLRDKLGKRFVGGIILTTGEAALPFGDRIAVAPIDTLWTT